MELFEALSPRRSSMAVIRCSRLLTKFLTLSGVCSQSARGILMPPIVMFSSMSPSLHHIFLNSYQKTVRRIVDLLAYLDLAIPPKRSCYAYL